MPSPKSPPSFWTGQGPPSITEALPRFMLWKTSSINLASLSLARWFVRHMGLAKKDHVRKLLEEPEVKEQWTALHHAAPQERDVEECMPSSSRR